MPTPKRAKISSKTNIGLPVDLSSVLTSTDFCGSVVLFSTGGFSSTITYKSSLNCVLNQKTRFIS